MVFKLLAVFFVSSSVNSILFWLFDDIFSSTWKHVYMCKIILAAELSTWKKTQTIEQLNIKLFQCFFLKLSKWNRDLKISALKCIFFWTESFHNNEKVLKRSCTKLHLYWNYILSVCHISDERTFKFNSAPVARGRGRSGIQAWNVRLCKEIADSAPTVKGLLVLDNCFSLVFMLSYTWTPLWIMVTNGNISQFNSIVKPLYC